MEKEKSSEPRLAKGLRMMELNGSVHRSITSTRPSITKPLTAPKKGIGHHQIPREFGSKPYHYNDTFTAAFDVLKYKANKQKKEIYAVQATLDDDTNVFLRKLDSDDAAKATMIRKVERWFRAYDYIADAIVVMEECSKSFVYVDNVRCRRLHLHIVTMMNDNEREIARDELLRGKITQRVTIQDQWTDKREYTDDDEWEEEEAGPIPKNAIDPDAEYWLNTYVIEEANKVTGEVIKKVCRRLPVCLRGVDYITKTIQQPIGRGKNYTFIGLKGRRERREELARLGHDMLGE